MKILYFVIKNEKLNSIQLEDHDNGHGFINNKDIIFYSLHSGLNSKQYKELYILFSNIFDNGHKLSNDELLTYDRKEKVFLIDYETILNGEEVKNIINSVL